MKPKLLITGVSGFIGGSLAEYYSNNDLDVRGLSRQTLDSSHYYVEQTDYSVDHIASIVRAFKPTAIIHAAGSSSVGASVTEPRQDFTQSVLTFHSLLEGVRLSEQKPLIVYPSSAAVYGNPRTLPVREDAELSPISPYGYHKMICEILAKEYYQCFGISSIVTRLFSVFGPKQKKLLLWELFYQFQNQAAITLEGTGEETRDYIYIDDLASAILKLLEQHNEGHTVTNVAGGTARSIKDVAYTIKRLLVSDKLICFQGKQRIGHPNKWVADVQYFETLTGQTIADCFEERLRRTINEWQK